GDFVVIKGQSAVGQINKINGKQAQVTFGSMVTNIALDRLLPSSPPKKEERADTFLTRQTQDDIRDRKLEFRQDIDVRGMRGDEAVQAITYYIDDALVAGVSRVRILHGTGSGILRSLIRQYLSNIEGVADFHDEDIRLGGAGITVVDLI
ncbi:MAG: Smr/MutS family protein, partial [Bacteroidaceae bacterium]|nr:Smr/MutS family protein [Bacteroidaceae bacterium]